MQTASRHVAPAIALAGLAVLLTSVTGPSDRAAAATRRERSESKDDPKLPLEPGEWFKQLPVPEDGIEFRGRLSYTLTGDWNKWPEDKRVRIVKAMDEAVWLYNRYGAFEKKLRVMYKSSIPTADGNINGTIRFGKSISTKTALHEISHTLGVGTSRKWDQMFKDKKWHGERANRLAQAFGGPDAKLGGDKSHFWPYGLNHKKEDSPTNRIRHVLMVQAMCQDMGERVFLRSSK